MMMWREGTVLRENRRWGQAIEYQVRVAHDPEIREAKALAYLPQVGEARIGDRVLLSTAAVARHLGTGGYLLIVAIPERLPADPPPARGHIVKARYTPSQFMVQGVDEQESPWHEQMAHADSLSGMPVIATDLHSALPAIAYTIARLRPGTRVAYVMNDGGALPAWFSMAGARLRELGLIHGTITCGQAYGGELEAVNVYTGLLAAKLVWHADIAIVTQGPGNLGTGTKWGFSGVNVGEALNAAGTLGGRPIAALRCSNADKRGRHYGISHHTMRVLEEVVWKDCAVPSMDYAETDELTGLLEPAFRAAVAQDLARLAVRKNLAIKPISTAGLSDILRTSPVPLRTMGRGLESDPASFLAASVAGSYAASLLAESGPASAH